VERDKLVDRIATIVADVMLRNDGVFSTERLECSAVFESDFPYSFFGLSSSAGM
jgi:hypothetical protein